MKEIKIDTQTGRQKERDTRKKETNRNGGTKEEINKETLFVFSQFNTSLSDDGELRSAFT